MKEKISNRRAKTLQGSVAKTLQGGIGEYYINTVVPTKLFQVFILGTEKIIITQF